MKTIACLTVLLAATVFAAPATRPAGLDQKTPKNTVKLFTYSLQVGDAAAVQACLHATGRTEEQFAQGYTDVSLATARLRRSIEGRFGANAMKALGASTNADEELRRIDQADERINGKSAVVEVKGREPVRMELTQVDGQWKIAISKLLAGRNEQKVQQDLGVMKAMTLAAHQTADEIQAGKYAKPEQALQAFQEKLKSTAKPEGGK